MQLPTGNTLFRGISDLLAMRRMKFALGWLIMLCAAAMPLRIQAATLVQVEVANFVFYVDDGSGQTSWATQVQATPGTLGRTFATFVGIGDIVAINGKPAHGTYVQRAQIVNSSNQPTAGQAIADTARGNFSDVFFDLMTADEKLAGSITGTGFLATSPPPGAPLAATQFTLAVTGGTGAFQGIRGQISGAANPKAGRGASINEDPSARRSLGGGGRLFLIQLTAEMLPQLIVTGAGPAIVHSSDFNLVSSSKPARSGEILSLFVTGLGPTLPGVDPGQPFPAQPLQTVNSPVDITVNGTAAEVLYAGGYPGSVDSYQVNFRLPSGLPAGMASLQISAAWIAGPAVPIAIQ
jgi:hypothetical protein